MLGILVLALALAERPDTTQDRDNAALLGVVAIDAERGARLSLFMQRYGTGGTPWTTIIDRRGVVRMNRFTAERAEMKRMIKALLAEPAPEPESDKKEEQKQKERDD